MCLCMIPVSIFVSRLGIIDSVNKIKIYTNLIKLFHFEILFPFKSSILIFDNIWDITWINIFINILPLLSFQNRL